MENNELFLTKEEIIQLKIIELKCKLKASDYKAIKYAEGLISEEEYQPIKEERQKLRDQINKLESALPLLF